MLPSARRRRPAGPTSVERVGRSDWRRERRGETVQEQVHSTLLRSEIQTRLRQLSTLSGKLSPRKILKEVTRLEGLFINLSGHIYIVGIIVMKNRIKPTPKDL